MASLIKCKVCGEDMSSAAVACPKCGHDNRNLWARSGCLGRTALVILAILGIAVFFAAIRGPADPASNTTATTTTSDKPRMEQQWAYSSSVDALSGKPTKTACITSENEVTQTFPYRNTTARLCVRQSPKFGFDIYLSLDSKGQIICRSYNNCPIRVRFDENPLRTFQGVEPADNSSETIFFSSARTMLTSLKATKRTVVEITLFQNGSQDLIFTTSGLAWP